VDVDDLRAKITHLLLHNTDPAQVLATWITGLLDEAYLAGYDDGRASAGAPVRRADDDDPPPPIVDVVVDL
jgi:hypothetical protein